MLISTTSLKAVLQNNVCEIKFLRRRPKIGQGAYRRMLCTNAPMLLNTVDGRVTLNYRPATGSLRFNPDQKNLVVAWDVFMQDYRCINGNSCDLITSIPANETFWTYFKKNLMGLTAPQKLAYMNT